MLLAPCLVLPRLIAAFQMRGVRAEIRDLNGLASDRFFFGLIATPMTVSFIGPQVNDSNIGVVKQVPDMEHLVLTNTSVTDAGVARLVANTKLRNLIICYCDLTKLVGKGAAHRNGSPKLDGNGLAALAQLPNLKEIQLVGTPTTDETLRSFYGLKQLVYLTLEKTQVTEQGVAELRKQLPSCKIVLDDRSDYVLTRDPP